MNTVILKWNPAFSSYSMLRFLFDIRHLNGGEEVRLNWSVWDYEHIHKGDRFYFVKVGIYGQIGIVGCGTIVSEPYEEDCWAYADRKRQYVNLDIDFFVNPDALPILTAKQLSYHIPDFEWSRGHSGVLLNAEQATQLNSMWANYLKVHAPDFEKAQNLDRGNKDLVYIKDITRQ